MFSVVLAKLLPERHNLYVNSLDFKLNIYKKKMRRDTKLSWASKRGIVPLSPILKPFCFSLMVRIQCMSTHSLKVHSFPWGIGGVLSLFLTVMIGFYEVHIRFSSSYGKSKSSFLVCFS